MAVAQNFDSGFHFNQALFRGRDGNASGKKEAGQSLQMSAAQTTPRHENLGLPSPHCLILNGM
jgi:hypothetical protein